MNIAKELDMAIKLLETGTAEGGYILDEKEYPNYMTNEEFEKFLGSMPPAVIEEYKNGGGGELAEKNARPPKMACYGSSGRMIYTLSRDKENFHYEKKLPTTIGGTANLDGFCEEENRYVFVEAKCHEPYSAKKNSVSRKYKRLYTYINEQMAGGLEIAMQESKCGKYMNVEYYAEGEKLAYFDLKQMICHLLGIATGILKGTLAKKQIDFIYLIYDPTELTLADGTKEAVDSIYERTCYECNLVDFATLFGVILAFLMEEKYGEAITYEEMENIVYTFTFSLATHEFYPVLLQSYEF